MSSYSQNPYRPKKSSGGVALNILLVVGGVVAVFVIVLILHQVGDQSATPPPADGGATTAPEPPAKKTDDSEYVKRGFTSNNGPRVSGNDNQPVKVSTRPASAGVVGDSEYKVYHTPECKYVRFIDADKKVSFASAADAFAKGYIPCKLCKPEVPAGVAVDTPTKTPVKGVGPAPRPISIPIRDVTVPYRYEILSRDVDNYRGSVCIDYTVNVLQKLAPDEASLLAQKLVYEETSKGPINAVSLTIRTDPGKTTVRWYTQIEWAPWGSLTRAGEVKAGDYSNHKFHFFDEATFKPKK